MRQQLLGYCSADPVTAERFRYMEAAHPKGAGFCRINRETADPGEIGIKPRHQQRFAFTVKAHGVGVPFLSEPLEMAMALGPRLRSQFIEPRRQFIDDAFELRLICSLS
jgi:hypothetical protein